MYTEDIKHVTKENTNFRKVLHTGTHSQLVAMSLPARSDIGEEIHSDTDQIIFIVEGEGQALLNGEIRAVGEHDVFFVPAGARHNVMNTSDTDLKLFTVYAPPAHPDGTIHATKAEAEKQEKTEGGG